MIRIFALTEAGADLGKYLAKTLDNAQLSYKPKPFSEEVQAAFKRGEKLIFICAMGIVIRTLAPVLESKKNDPPVIVLDELSNFVIPILSGHEGGANEFARDIAERLNAQLVLTTANPYLHPIYTVGMGCERHCPRSELQQLLETCLDQQGLTLQQINCISSIDIKSDEQGLIELAEHLGLPFITWGANTLRNVEDQLSTHSDYIFNTVGVYGVAESAALYTAQEQTQHRAELVMNKQKTAKATCAIARSYHP